MLHYNSSLFPQNSLQRCIFISYKQLFVYIFYINTFCKATFMLLIIMLCWIFIILILLIYSLYLNYNYKKKKADRSALFSDVFFFEKQYK